MTLKHVDIQNHLKMTLKKHADIKNSRKCHQQMLTLNKHFKNDINKC